MWICLSDCFLSIVHKDCARDELLVRARRRGDIETVFPYAKVICTPAPADYRFRAVVRTHEVIGRMAGEIRRITYSNFKDSVGDQALHDAYLKVWTAMMSVQPFSSDGKPPKLRGLIMPSGVNPFDPKVAKRRRAMRKKP